MYITPHITIENVIIEDYIMGRTGSALDPSMALEIKVPHRPGDFVVDNQPSRLPNFGHSSIFQQAG